MGMKEDRDSTYRPSIEWQIAPRIRPCIEALRAPDLCIVAPDIGIAVQQGEAPDDIRALCSLWSDKGRVSALKARVRKQLTYLLH